ncbi:MAG TPA: HlyD family type I secretion periplasmic adaptor subunit [Terriglobales bacterium]|nr:HlyD family type I secretion periplasmic adaptor subunit [Terriglobales bacterium]
MSLTNRDLWIDPSHAEKEGTRLFGHILLFTVATVIIVALVWANFAVLDQVTRGEAKVVPSSATQLIQSAEGGLIKDLKVKEGDIVEPGQVLVEMDNTTVSTDVNELQQRYWTGLAASSRLQAEVDGKSPDQIQFDPDLLAKAPEVAEAERAQARIRQMQLQSQIATLQDTINQREQELRSIDVKVSSSRVSLGLAQRRADLQQKVYASGAGSEAEYISAQQEVQRIATDIANAEASRPPAQAALQEAQSKAREAVATFRADASTDLAKHRADLASVTQLLAGGTTKLGHQVLRSPVHGTVKEIKMKTVGGVAQPAQEIMEIVPIEDTLLIEAQIRPQDRGFIAPDQHAKVKITAYDYSIYGGLDAKVEEISADAIENDKKETFFRVRLRTDKNYLIGKQGEELPIIPGMTATVDILTGKRTVLEYLLKPILKARQTAFTER